MSALAERCEMLENTAAVKVQTLQGCIKFCLICGLDLLSKPGLPNRPMYTSSISLPFPNYPTNYEIKEQKMYFKV